MFFDRDYDDHSSSTDLRIFTSYLWQRGGRKTSRSSFIRNCKILCDNPEIMHWRGLDIDNAGDFFAKFAKNAYSYEFYQKYPEKSARRKFTKGSSFKKKNFTKGFFTENLLKVHPSKKS